MSFSVESLILRLEKENTLTPTQYETIRKACKEEKYMQRFESIMRASVPSYMSSYSKVVVKHIIVPFNLIKFEKSLQDKLLNERQHQQVYFPTLQTVYDESKVKELSNMMDTMFEKVTESRTIASFKYQRKCYKRDRFVISKFVRKLNKRLSKYGLNKVQIETIKDVVRDTHFGYKEVKRMLLTSSTTYDDFVGFVIVPANCRKSVKEIQQRIDSRRQRTDICFAGEYTYTVGVSKTSRHDVEFVIGVGPDSINGLLDEVVEVVNDYDSVPSALYKPFESKHLTLKDGTPLRYILRRRLNYMKAKDLYFYKNTYIGLGLVSETAKVLYVEIGDSNNKLSHEEGWESFGAKTDFTLVEGNDHVRTWN